MKNRIKIWALTAGIAFLVSAVLIQPQNLFATACSAARNTPEKDPPKVVSLTVASNVVIYAGSIVCVNSAGKAVPGADSSGYAVVGRAESTVDNRTAVYSATAKISARKGVFRWANADAITIADVGKLVYVTDDATVNKTGGGQNIIAGTVYDIDSDGVWVDTGKIGPSGAATPASLAVSGNSALTGTLAVTGASTLTGNTYEHGTLVVNDAVTHSNVLTQVGAATMNSTLAVQGTTTLTNLTVHSAAVTFTGLPTATNGLTSGQIWLNSNVLTVIP